MLLLYTYCIPQNKEHCRSEFQLPARVESLFIFEDLTGFQLLLINCLPLLCELAPVLLALNTDSSSNEGCCLEYYIFCIARLVQTSIFKFPVCYVDFVISLSALKLNVFLLVVTAVGWYRKWNARLKLMTLMLTSFNYWPNLPSVR